MIVGLGVAAAWQPAAALPLLAALTPLSPLLLPARGPGSQLRLAEALTLVFFAGWCLRLVWHRSPLRMNGPSTAIALFAACIVTSAVVVMAAEGAGGEAILGSLRVSYLLPWFPGIEAAALLIEGLALIATVATLAMQRRATLGLAIRSVAATGLLIALFNILALASELAGRSASRGGRLSTTFADFNAAGSYLVLTLPLVYIELRGISRWATVIACAIVLEGIWLTGSRSAVVPAIAIALIPGLSARLSVSGRAWWMLAALGAGAAAVFALAAIELPELLHNVGPVGAAMKVRSDFVETSLNMLERFPWFGIGIGNYYESSWYYMPYELFMQYQRENAHNNFLQIAAELGLTGIVAFVMVIGSIIVKASGRARRGGDSRRLWAVVVSLCGFLLTCVTGHPLLVPEVAYSFWIVAGIATAMAYGDGAARATGRAERGLLVAAIVLLVVSVPARITSAERSADWSEVTRGLGPEERGPDARPFRRILGSAILFVPPHYTRAEVPLLGMDAYTELWILVDGRIVTTVGLLPHTWTSVPVALQRLPDRRTFHRIDLVILCRQEENDCGDAGRSAGVGRFGYGNN